MALMPLVIAGGMAKGYLEDVAEKKAKLAKIEAIKTEWLLNTGLAKIEKRREQRKAAQARISTATRLGFDEKAAIALEASGELSSVITRVEKLIEDPEKDVSTSSIKKMSQAILDNVPQDRLAKAVEYALDLGAAEEMTAEKLINTIFSTSDESEKFAAVADISTGTDMPSIKPTGINLIGLTDLSPEKTQKVRNLIEDRLKDSLGRTLTKDGYVWDNPGAANTIIEKALTYYIEQRADPFLDKDLADITTDISDKVQYLIGEGIPLNTIANQYEFSLKPTEFDYTPTTSPTQQTTPIAPPSSIIDENYQD